MRIFVRKLKMTIAFYELVCAYQRLVIRTFFLNPNANKI